MWSRSYACNACMSKVVTLTKFKLGFPFLSRLVRSFVYSLPPSTLHKETPTTCIASTFCVVEYKKTHWLVYILIDIHARILHTTLALSWRDDKSRLATTPFCHPPFLLRANWQRHLLLLMDSGDQEDYNKLPVADRLQHKVHFPFFMRISSD